MVWRQIFHKLIFKSIQKTQKSGKAAAQTKIAQWSELEKGAWAAEWVWRSGVGEIPKCPQRGPMARFVLKNERKNWWELAEWQCSVGRRWWTGQTFKVCVQQCLDEREIAVRFPPLLASCQVRWAIQGLTSETTRFMSIGFGVCVGVSRKRSAIVSNLTDF